MDRSLSWYSLNSGGPLALRSMLVRLRRWAAAALAALGALVLLVSVSPFVYWAGGVLAGPWSDVSGEVLIVPGGSSLDGMVLGENSYWRSVYAVRAWRRGGFRRVVLTGGPAPLMRDFLTAHGVPPEVIEVETRSISTRENVRFTADLLRGSSDRLVLLTSDFHMYRARRVFRNAGLDVLPLPVPDVRKRASRWQGRWPAFLELVIEAAKIGYYRVKGWI